MRSRNYVQEMLADRHERVRTAVAELAGEGIAGVLLGGHQPSVTEQHPGGLPRAEHPPHTHPTSLSVENVSLQIPRDNLIRKVRKCGKTNNSH